MVQYKTILIRASLLLICCFTIACSAKEPAPAVVDAVIEPQIVSERAATIPPGVVRYCWEEPIVALEQNGPGLDADGHWYHPHYTAVREVRQGRWRPCRTPKSERSGDLVHER